MVGALCLARPKPAKGSAGAAGEAALARARQASAARAEKARGAKRPSPPSVRGDAAALMNRPLPPRPPRRRARPPQRNRRSHPDFDSRPPPEKPPARAPEAPKLDRPAAGASRAAGRAPKKARGPRARSKAKKARAAARCRAPARPPPRERVTCQGEGLVCAPRRLKERLLGRRRPRGLPAAAPPRSRAVAASADGVAAIQVPAHAKSRGDDDRGAAQ